MNLKTLNYRFWIISIASIVIALVTLKLGFWQQSRAHEKLALEASILSQAALPTLSASALTENEKLSVLHRTVTITGQWLPQYTLFLDNRQMDNKPGFFVVTPFEFVNKGTQNKQIILVQRGWVARNFSDRTKLPNITSEASVITIVGRIAPSPSKLFEFRGDENGAIRQNIDIYAAAKEFKIRLLPYSLLQLNDIGHEDSTENQKDQLLRNWPKANYGAEKNFGYMVQWWALSALVVFLYVWFQLVRPHIKSMKNHKPNK